MANDAKTYSETHEFTLKAGTDLGEAASKVFGGLKIPHRQTVPGATSEETMANILRAAGSHENARAIFVSGGERLARQKDIKALAQELAPRVILGEKQASGETLTEAEQKLVTDGVTPLSRDEAVQQLIDRGAREAAPTVTVRGEGTTTRKPTVKQVEKAKEAVVAEAKGKLEAMSPADRKKAEALLAQLGLA